MKKYFFTKLEGRIMEVLWREGPILSISGMKAFIPELEVMNIRQVIHRLEKNGIVKVAGYGENQYSVMRLYAPTITQCEYYKDIITDETKSLLAMDLLENTEDCEILKNFYELSKKRLEEMKNNNTVEKTTSQE